MRSAAQDGGDDDELAESPWSIWLEPMIVHLMTRYATNTVAAKDLNAGAGMGLLRRVENLVRNAEDYRAQVQGRYEHAVRRIDELVAVADTPFERTGELADKQSELEQLSAQLRVEASGPDARRGRAGGGADGGDGP